MIDYKVIINFSKKKKACCTFRGLFFEFMQFLKCFHFSHLFLNVSRRSPFILILLFFLYLLFLKFQLFSQKIIISFIYLFIYLFIQ